MKRVFNLLSSQAVFGLLFLSSSFSAMAQAGPLNQTIVSRTAEVGGVKVHYLTAGRGATLILLRLRTDLADVAAHPPFAG